MDNWFNTVVLASIVSVLLAYFLNNLGKIIRFATQVVRWVWNTVVSFYHHFLTMWRKRKALRVIENMLASQTLTISIEAYESCLRQNPTESRRALLGSITPATPKWLNDYYVTTALETLFQRSSVVKAKRYEIGRFPPSANTYLFRLPGRGDSAEEEAREIETNSMCSIYQQFNHCLLDGRFNRNSYGQTVSYDRVEYENTVELNDSAPPCERCWDKQESGQRMRMLVTNLLRNELWDTIRSLPWTKICDETLKGSATGVYDPFIESLASACIESGLSHEAVGPVLEAVELAVRAYELELPDLSDEEGVERFKTALKAAIASNRLFPVMGN